MIHQIAATLLLMIVFGTLYGALRDRYPKGSLVFKASATCMTVWNCGSGLAAGKQGFSDWMIFVGLLFCVLADVLLEFYGESLHLVLHIFVLLQEFTG